MERGANSPKIRCLPEAKLEQEMVCFFHRQGGYQASYNKLLRLNPIHPIRLKSNCNFMQNGPLGFKVKEKKDEEPSQAIAHEEAPAEPNMGKDESDEESEEI